MSSSLPSERQNYALIVEDESQVAEVTRRRIEDHCPNLDTEIAFSYEDAVYELENDDINSVISDYELPDSNGLDLLEHVRDNYGEMPFVLFTGQGSEEVASDAFRLGADDYVKKTGNSPYERICETINDTMNLKSTEMERDIFKEIVDNAGHVVKVTNNKGEIVHVNDAFEETTGYYDFEVLGENPAILNSGEHSAEFYNDMWTTITSGETWEGEIVNETAEGEQYWVKQTISPVENHEGEIEYFVAISNDISKEKMKEQKKEFLNSLLRHDISNNHQMMMSDIWRIKESEELPESLEDKIDNLDQTLDDNVKLVDGVRGLLGDEEPSMNYRNPGKIVNSRIAKYDQWVGRGVFEFDVDIEPFEIKTGSLVDHMFENVIENSVNHSNGSKLVIETEDLDEQLKLSFKDDGDGLGEDFSWEKGVKSEDSKGTGMGTWLIKEIAEAYNIGLEKGSSNLGGAEFNFFFNEYREHP